MRPSLAIAFTLLAWFAASGFSCHLSTGGGPVYRAPPPPPRVVFVPAPQPVCRVVMTRHGRRCI